MQIPDNKLTGSFITLEQSLVTHTHRNIWQYVCRSMWPDTIEMWSCTVNSSQHKGRPNVALVSVISTHSLTLVALLQRKKCEYKNYQKATKLFTCISNATSSTL